MVAPPPGCGELNSTPPSTEECGASPYDGAGKGVWGLAARDLGRIQENRSGSFGSSEISSRQMVIIDIRQSDSAPSVGG